MENRQPSSKPSAKSTGWANLLVEVARLVAFGALLAVAERYGVPVRPPQSLPPSSLSSTNMLVSYQVEVRDQIWSFDGPEGLNRAVAKGMEEAAKLAAPDKPQCFLVRQIREDVWVVTQQGVPAVA